MTIGELARAAHVTPRTIRYYISEGLLKPPGKGRYAEYNNDHLETLLLIGRLKAQFLPLEEIRARLDGAQMPERSYTPSAGTTADLSQGTALDYLRSLATTDVPPPARMLAPPAPASTVYTGSISTQKTRPEYEQQRDGEGENWRRLIIAPGVEVSYRSELDPKLQSSLLRLIYEARRIFRNVKPEGK